MNTYMTMKRFLVALLAMGGMSLALANTEESDICSPFRDGKVDEATVATMLDAAEGGYLYRIRRDTSQVGFCVSSGWTQVKGQFRHFSKVRLFVAGLVPNNTIPDGDLIRRDIPFRRRCCNQHRCILSQLVSD